MGTDFDIDQFLRETGYDNDRDRARAILCEQRLTAPHKTRMAEWKKSSAIQALKARLIITCPSQKCLEEARQTGRTRVPAMRPQDCEFCGGSPNAQAVNLMVKAALAKNIQRIVVVGGSAGTQEDLLEKVGDRLQVRWVDGSRRRTHNQAFADMLWAQLIVIWGSTELRHRCSELYTNNPRTRVVTVHRRGVAALAEFVRETLEKI